MDLESHRPLCSSAGLVPWNWGNQITVEVLTFPGNTGHFVPHPTPRDLKSQRRVRELKNLLFSGTYWEKIERFINLQEKYYSYIHTQTKKESIK